MSYINSVQEEKKLNTASFIDVLSRSFTAYSKQNIIYRHPSVFVQGQPGIGKSQAIFKIADNLKKALNKDVYVNDIRLLLFNPVDLRGIPVPNHEKKEAVWLKPEVFRFDENEDSVNILFMDELTSAPSSLQAVAYQIALDRRLGEHKIPDNTFIVAAGNRLADHAVTYEMPTALRNRFMHFELVIDFKSWLKWAKEKQIHACIIDFLIRNPDKFTLKDFETTSNIIVTPRSWEFLSDILKTLGGNVLEQEPYISSIIGNSLASLMLNKDVVVNIDEILEGKYPQEELSISQVQRIIDVLEDQFDEYFDDIEKINNLFGFLLTIPMDYGLNLFRNLVKESNTDINLLDIENYRIFINKLEKLTHE